MSAYEGSVLATGDNAPVVFDYAELTSACETDGIAFEEKIEKAYGMNGLGLCLVKGVPGLAEARQKLLNLAWVLTRLPDETLEKYERPDAAYCFGWSRGREKFQGKPDLAKGSFYANPVFEDPADGDETIRKKYTYGAHGNVWPDEVPELQKAFKDAGRLLYETAQPLVRMMDNYVNARHPGHGTQLYDCTFKNSRMLLGRLLHYYAGDEGSWCGWHNDNSTITGLYSALFLNEDTGAEIGPPKPREGDGLGAGLYAKSMSNQIVKVAIPPDCIAFQLGESAQIISGGLLRATPHHVKGHSYRGEEGEVRVSRETFALFMQPQWDMFIAPPPDVTYYEVLKNEETELIPPLSRRLKPLPECDNKVHFGKFLEDSFNEYYKHNNKEEI